MWPWIKRWRDWAMHDFWPVHRTSPQPQALHFSFEKAGLTLHDQPIPWNAEAVLVEARVRLPAAGSRRKGDFLLRVQDADPQPAESLRRPDNEEYHRVLFRIPPPKATVAAEVLWRERALGQLTLPVLTCEDFVKGLRLHMPTLFVRVADETVACQTFVSTQCKGLLFSALVVSPTSLVPLLDLDLQLEVRNERGGPAQLVPARLCSSQLGGRQALVTVIPRRFPRRRGAWIATWLLGDRPLASQRVKAISAREFHGSLRVSDTRFVTQQPKTGVSVTRQLPPLELISRAGPCFLVSSKEPGMAGVCRLSVRAQVSGAVQQPVLLDEEVLITDGPTAVAPGTIDVGDLGQVTGFELALKSRTLGVLTVCPAPTATFTSEGGFLQVQDFAWSVSAEEELNERLGKLFDGPGSGR